MTVLPPTFLCDSEQICGTVGALPWPGTNPLSKPPWNQPQVMFDVVSSSPMLLPPMVIVVLAARPSPPSAAGRYVQMSNVGSASLNVVPEPAAGWLATEVGPDALVVMLDACGFEVLRP